MRSSYTLLYISGLLLGVLLMLTACHEDTVYNHFEQPFGDGWDRSDTLRFEVPSIAADGNYQVTLQVRTDVSYPYRNLSFVVEQTLMPRQQVRRDTVNCQLVDKRGMRTGSGVSQFQYSFPMRQLLLHKKQTVRFAVFHCMKLEVLPGVMDVGIRISDDKK